MTPIVSGSFCRGGWFAKRICLAQYVPVLVFLLIDIAPAQRCGMIAVAQLELAYRTSLSQEKILTTSKIEFPHTNKPVVIMLVNASWFFDRVIPVTLASDKTVARAKANPLQPEPISST